MNTPRTTLLSALALAALTLPAAATRYYVDDDAPPGGDGLSWATAFDSLDDALALIGSGDRIWLAEGTYTPGVEQVPGDPRSVTFHFPAGVWMYGGFAGNELTLAERAGLFDSTILTGEIGAPGVLDNAYHVVTVRHPSGIPPGGNRIDGVTVRHGNATGGTGQGGGVLSFNVALRLANVTLHDNLAVNGAGVHAQPGSLSLIDCELRDNRAANNGGGMWGQAVNFKVFSTRFHGNSAGSKGGAAYVHSIGGVFETVLYANSVFHDNVAPVGGAVFVGGGQFSYGIATFKDCTFALNQASLRGGAIRANTTPALPARVWLYNSVVWANTAPDGPGISGRLYVAHSNVQDASYSALLGNLSQPPQFVDLFGRDLHLVSGSPCVDAGDNGQVARDYLDLDGDGNTLEPVPLDHDGLRRFVDDPATPDTGLGSPPIVDMGAYELAAP